MPTADIGTGRGDLKIATRLILVLTALAALVVAVYSAVSQQQREALLRAAHVRETATLARTLQVVTGNALRDGRLGDLRRVYAALVTEPNTFAATVWDAQGRTLAGGTDGHEPCADDFLVQGGRRAGSGWAECEVPVYWVRLPLPTAGASLLIARRATVITRDVADSRRRLVLLAVAIVGASALATHSLLRRALSAPLAELLRGVRSLGESGAVHRVQVSAAAGELSQLATAFNEMAQQLETQRTALLQAAVRRAGLEKQLHEADKFAALGRLSGGLAHEIGSPLNVILMRSEHIAASDVPETARQQATAIAQQVNRISDLIRGLLLIARRDRITPEQVNLAAVAREAAAELLPRAAGHGIFFHLRIPSEPVLVSGDATLLRHALLNLGNNAVLALEGHAAPRQLWLALEQKANATLLVVEDSGPGIVPADMPHVFEPFFTTREGTGLGLAISRSIAEAHGGSLQLAMRAGGGIRATLRLPPGVPTTQVTP